MFCTIRTMKCFDAQFAQHANCDHLDEHLWNLPGLSVHPNRRHVRGGKMNFADLEAFVSVLDHGSIVGASAALHLTQSAVSRRIQNLEDVLGVPLLDRQMRPLQPTRAGSETYSFAKPVLSSVRDLKMAVMLNGETSGNLRFGMSRSLGDITIVAPIRRVRTEFP